MTAEDYSLKRFASHPFYTAMNRRLVKLCELRPWQRVVDLGCGTGAVTELILEEMQPDKGEVVGVDPSPCALEVARRDLQEKWGAVVKLMAGHAENLSRLVKRAADTVVFCNAIHLIEDKRCVLREISESLQDRGVFAFNSAFFEGAQPADTFPFYTAWVRRALHIFKNEYPDVRREKEERAQARIQLTPDEYEQILGEEGFALKHLELCPAEMPLEGFEDISRYDLFAAGALPGVPLAVAVDCLVRGCREAFRDLDLTSVTRNWLQVVAVKA
jgi:ubiquinone/menaquinone biosynthesis C-methylase UbiE